MRSNCAGLRQRRHYHHPGLAPACPNWLYVVTPQPDDLYHRVKVAGLKITREIEDTSYGNRTFTVEDPWSVSWSFGTYPGS